MAENRPAKRIGSATIAWTAAVAAIVVAMYWQVAGYFAHRWVDEDEYHHCLLVPLVVAWLIYRQRDKLSKLSVRPGWRGLGLLAVGGLMYVIAMRTGVRVAIGLSFPVVVVGLVWAALGNSYAKVLAYPLALLVFLVPVPRHMLGHLGMPLQVMSAAGAAKAAPLIGLPVVHDGINLTLHGHTYAVAHECSGLNSLLALLFAGAVLVEIMEVRWLARLVLLLTPGIVLAANTVRLTSVLIFAEFAGPQFAMDSLVHGGSDIIVYLVALIFMWLLIDLASERRVVAILLGTEESSTPNGTGERQEEARVAAGDEEARTQKDAADTERLPLESVCK